MKKVLPPVLFILFVIMMGIVYWGFGFKHYVTYPYNLTGITLLIAGLVTAQASKVQFIKLKTNVNTFEEPGQLVTGGWYKYSRNPMYLGLTVALLGVAVLLQGSVSSLLIVVLYIIITDRWYIRFEERTLFAKFGAEYTLYKQNTRRWI